jgi:hypothetical protein
MAAPRLAARENHEESYANFRMDVERETEVEPQSDLIDFNSYFRLVIGRFINLMFRLVISTFDVARAANLPPIASWGISQLQLR